MTNEPDTANVPAWQPPRITRSMHALIRSLLARCRSIDVPHRCEERLPRGCAFVVRYTSPSRER